MQNSLEQLKNSLKEMFQFQNNDLNFGIYKIYKLKQKEIEKFIDDNLENIVKKELQNVSNLEEKSNLLELELFLKWFNQEKLLEDINSNYEKIDWFINLWWNWDTEKLKEILKSGRNWSIEWDLENKIYNYILNFFELYYSEWDFGYNTRSLNTYKVEYSESNEESEWEEISQNNNRETEFKHYKFNRIENIWDTTFKVIFNLSKTSTAKEEILKKIFEEIYGKNLGDEFLFNKEWKSIFNSLDKNFGKIENWNMKGFSQLKIKKDDLVKKYDSNFWKWEKINKSFDELDKSSEIENTIITLWSLDNKLNSFYIWNDSDFFIHKNLNWFLTKEKEKFIKNNILWDLSTILNLKIDNTSLVIAKTFNEISSKIIEFLSAIEEFQKWIFESKKKVLVSEYCITLDKIEGSFYDEILANKEQIQEWKNLWFISDEKVLSIDYLKENQTLNIDTKFFSKDFKDRLLNTFEDLEEETNGILINSENFQALNLLKNKYRGKIKCIYIDPPYNTGSDWFVYKDSFKHSSWLSMMENKLELAKEFLSDDWVIFVSIDDNEQDNLKKLMDEVFGSENFVGRIAWESKTKSQNTKDAYRKLQPRTENIFVYFRNQKINFNLIVKWKKEYKEKDEKWFFRFSLIEQMNAEWIRWRNTMIFDIFWITPPGWKQWQLWKETIELFKKRWDILIKNNKPYLKMRPDDERSDITLPFWALFSKEIWTTESAKKELWNFFIKNRFDTVKPVNLVKKVIFHWSNPNDIILDFFSWSWTTQHAVIELNKEDNWKRKYIWVEMWEYFDTVTKPRIQKVIYSSNWENWKPQDNNWVSQILKYQVLEQYEDMLDKLEIDTEEFPAWLDIKYLYKKEEI